jgi:putative endonuclease
MANTNGRAATLYVGMTNNLERRAAEHRHPELDGANHRFTRRYRLTRLVHCEDFQDVRDAIAREKQIKGWRRDRKIVLIESENPDWHDLFEET